jgi:two-component system response regulator GlrR
MDRDASPPVLGRSAAHQRVLDLVTAAAQTTAEVLIVGPSGVGKERYARLIHDRGARAGARFVPVNCGALPPDLFENEFFGHVAGAFTGARPRAEGLVKEAAGGTLFLDEVESLHPVNQVKLLRLIQEKEYRPLGEPRVRRIDVRFIAASNADLLAETRQGRFRLDLFFRLRVLPVPVPPLRERPEDVPLLLDHFIRKYVAEYGKDPVTFTPRALARLLAYAWPGNVRELENCVRYLLCTSAGKLVDADDLPLLEVGEGPGAGSEGAVVARAAGDGSASAIAGESAPSVEAPLGLAKRRLVSEFERAYVCSMLARTQGNIAAAARAAGKNRRAFFELMRRYGIRPAR